MPSRARWTRSALRGRVRSSLDAPRLKVFPPLGDRSPSPLGSSAKASRAPAIADLLAVGRRLAGSMRLVRLAKMLPAINWPQTVGRTAAPTLDTQGEEH